MRLGQVYDPPRGIQCTVWRTKVVPHDLFSTHQEPLPWMVLMSHKSWPHTPQPLRGHLVKNDFWRTFPVVFSDLKVFARWQNLFDKGRNFGMHIYDVCINLLACLVLEKIESKFQTRFQRFLDVRQNKLTARGYVAGKCYFSTWSKRT